MLGKLFQLWLSECVLCGLWVLWVVFWGYHLFSWIWLICHLHCSCSCLFLYLHFTSKEVRYKYYGGNVCKVNYSLQKISCTYLWFLITYWSFMVMCFLLLPIEYRISQVRRMPSLPYSIHPTVFCTQYSLTKCVCFCTLQRSF